MGSKKRVDSARDWPRICMSKRMGGLEKLLDKFAPAQKLSDLQNRWL